ncbi:hypothetical protein SVAN01_10134 [Stagonosporopsis vannaccii]|nr:hypothetical protein SVAN01_10134 [Stagonosporopsis vannaccii]
MNSPAVLFDCLPSSLAILEVRYNADSQKPVWIQLLHLTTLCHTAGAKIAFQFK